MTMDIVDRSVVAVVKALGRQLTGETVKVELVTMADGSPICGRVGWSSDLQAWRVLGVKQLTGRRLLHHCLHELGHVVLGHVDQVDDVLLDVDKAVMEGKSGGWLGASRRGVLADYVETWQETPQEAEAEAWVDDQLDRWWAVVEGVARGAADALGASRP